MRGTKEMLDMMESFEIACRSDCVGYLGCKIERTEKGSGSIRDFYNNGELNEKFIFFMMGWQAGKNY